MSKTQSQATRESGQALLDNLNSRRRSVTEMQTAFAGNEVAQRRLLSLSAQELKDTVSTETATRRLSEERQRQIGLIGRSNSELREGASATELLVSATERVGSGLARIVKMGAYRILSQMWREAKTFAMDYNASLNEIRIVTGLTQSESEKLGTGYLQLADKMSAKSVEVANAAADFYRQGLGESEVDARLQASIKYAKISGLEFEQAAQIITAATNSMGLSANRVIDVFATLGDESAAGADEIGIAMQRSAAAANAFGLSFEHLGSYIATISEKTRLPAETVGIAFNTLLARMHEIKEKGFNSEDDVGLNQVSKALDKVGVSIMDAEGKWKPFNQVLEEVASQWTNLDDVTKAYIATTMAGVRRQNQFLTLMDDLALGADGGSRAFELYSQAIDSAGSATEKFSIWQEGAAAASDKFHNSMSMLYEQLHLDVVIKEAFEGLTSFVKNLTAGLGNWDVKTLALAASMGMLVIAIAKVVAGLHSLFIMKTLTTGWMGLLAAALGAITIGAISFAGSMKVATDEVASMEEKVAKISASKDLYKSRIDEIETLKSRYLELSGTVNRTQGEQEELNGVMA